jgi:dTMP kinase
LNEALLFLAAIGHAMPLIFQAPKGAIRIADRFVWSTLAYQGYGGGVPLDFLKDLTATVIGNLWPDLTIYLDIPPLGGLARHTDTGQKHFAQPDFRSMVRNGYLTMAEQLDWLVIDATQPPNEIHKEVLKRVLSLLS